MMPSDGHCSDRSILILDSTLPIRLCGPAGRVRPVLHEGAYDRELVIRDGLLGVFFRQIFLAVRKRRAERAKNSRYAGRCTKQHKQPFENRSLFFGDLDTGV